MCTINQKTFASYAVRLGCIKAVVTATKKRTTKSNQQTGQPVKEEKTSY